ncbi:MAG: SCO family protein [Verrucomicrobiaceae bacterium]
MTPKKQIVLIYSVVGVISAFILGMSLWLATLKKTQASEGPVAEDVGKVEVESITTLETDLELVKQDGTPVKISDLKDKVWVAAQFFAVCPMCAERNGKRLLEVYNTYKDDPNFVIVCMSVDPEADTQEHLLDLEKGLGVDRSNWWFVKTDRETIHNYMRYEMLFGDVRERTVPEEIAAKGKWAHDMGLQVWRGDTLIKKWDEVHGPGILPQAIEKALKDLKEEE